MAALRPTAAPAGKRCTYLVEAAGAGRAGVGTRRHGARHGRVQAVLARVGQREAPAVQRDAHGDLFARHSALDVVVDGEVLSTGRPQRLAENHTLRVRKIGHMSAVSQQFESKKIWPKKWFKNKTNISDVTRHCDWHPNVRSPINGDLRGQVNDPKVRVWLLAHKFAKTGRKANILAPSL